MHKYLLLLLLMIPGYGFAANISQTDLIGLWTLEQTKNLKTGKSMPGGGASYDFGGNGSVTINMMWTQWASTYRLSKQGLIIDKESYQIVSAGSDSLILRSGSTELHMKKVNKEKARTETVKRRQESDRTAAANGKLLPLNGRFKDPVSDSDFNARLKGRHFRDTLPFRGLSSPARIHPGDFQNKELMRFGLGWVSSLYCLHNGEKLAEKDYIVEGVIDAYSHGNARHINYYLKACRFAPAK